MQPDELDLCLHNIQLLNYSSYVYRYSQTHRKLAFMLAVYFYGTVVMKLYLGTMMSQIHTPWHVPYATLSVTFTPSLVP